MIGWTVPPTIELEKFLLTALTTEHAQALFELRTNDAAMEYINKEKPTTVDQVLAMIRGMQQEFLQNKTCAWAIMNKADERLVGTIGYYRILPEHYRAEIGYMLHPDFWGRGIMRRVIEVVIDIGFSEFNFHSIEARINPANNNSRKILERSGFVKEGYLRESFYFDGNFLDTEVFGLVKR